MGVGLQPSRLLLAAGIVLVTSCFVGSFDEAGGPSPGDDGGTSGPEASTPGGDAGAPVSCASGARAGADHACGITHDQDCCASPIVDGGTFLRSFDGVGLLDDGHPAMVSPFRLDRFEVTVGRFRSFVEAGMGTQSTPPPSGAGALSGHPESGWNPAWTSMLPGTTSALRAQLACEPRATWGDATTTHEDTPINCVSWFLAFAFCAWDGGRLPTEAEWNFAAAAGSLQRVYPWSDPPDSGALSSDLAEYGCDIVGACGAGQGLAAAGSKPLGAGAFAQLDLAGNVAEWTLDAVAYPFDPSAYLDPCTDCVDLEPNAPTRAIRGGSFATLDAGALRAGARAAVSATVTDPQLGFRCARSP